MSGIDETANEPRRPDRRNQEHSAADQSEPEQQDETQGNRVEVGVSDTHNGHVTVAGRDNYTINKDNINLFFADLKKGEIRKFLRGLSEDERVLEPPPSLPDNPALTEEIERWFGDKTVSDQEKFFTLTLSIFSGLKYADFLDIYRVVCRKFITICADERENPPSRFSYEDDHLIEKTQAEIVPSENGLEEIIRFKDPKYGQAVFNYMRSKHRDILLDTLPVLANVVENYRYWEVRSRAAYALYEIGKLGFQRVRRLVLEPWALHSLDYVRASIGYPATRLFQDDKTRPAVNEMLEDWISNSYGKDSSLTWRARWAAASVYKQLGTLSDPKAQEMAFKGLTTLAGVDDIRVGDAVIHSMVAMSLKKQLLPVLSTLQCWLEQGSAGKRTDTEQQVRCIVAILTFIILAHIHLTAEQIDAEEGTDDGQVFASDSLFDRIQDSGAEQSQLWQMIVAFGVRAFEMKLAPAFFDLIIQWTEYAGENGRKQHMVLNYLEDVYVQAIPLHKEYILNRLQIWEKQKKNPGLAEMASMAKEQIKTRMLGNISHTRIQWG